MRTKAVREVATGMPSFTVVLVAITPLRFQACVIGSLEEGKRMRSGREAA